MLPLWQFRPASRCLSDVLPWALLFDPETVITKDAGFLTVLSYRPRDLASSTPAQLLSARAALNNPLKRFGAGHAIWFEAQRNETAEYPASTWPDPVSRLIDEQRRALFTACAAQYETTHYIAFLYMPPNDASGKISSLFLENEPERRGGGERFRAELEGFRDRVASFRKMLEVFMPSVSTLGGDALLTYLHSTISTKRHPVTTPAVPLLLDGWLADCEFVGGRQPMLGEHHLRTVRIRSTPASTHPGILDELNGVDFPYRQVCRWLPFDKEDAKRLLETRKKHWAAQRKSIMAHAMERFFPDDGSKNDPDAELKMLESDEAIAALGTDDLAFGLFSETITVTDPDIHVVTDRARQIENIINTCGMIASTAQADATSTWLGSVPGNPWADAGRLLGSSLTFCDVAPATAVWSGPQRDDHLNGPELLRCLSDGGTAFRMVLHPEGSDLGHTAIIGESGAGKSTLIATMLAAYRKYPGSRAIVIDRGELAKCITLALGGSFHALGGDDASISIAPLMRIDEPAELAWSFDWVLGLLAQEGVTMTPEMKQELHGALENLASRPMRQRTLSVLRALVQDNAIKAALSTFCIGGPCGDLLDNDEDRLELADTVCFETAALLERPIAIGPVLACVFHAIERRMDGRPTALFVDEAWSILDRPLLAGKLREYLKTARKANCQVILASQSLVDIARSSIREVVSESVHNRIYTANTRAQETASAAVLEEFGLNPKQIAILANLLPKREYVFASPDGWRKLELGLSPLELAFVGKSRPGERAAMDRILAAYPREEFAWRWLAECGFAGEQIEAWRRQAGVPGAPYQRAAE